MATAAYRNTFPGHTMIHTLQKVADNGSDKLSELKSKYLTKTMDSGKDFLEARYEKVSDLFDQLVKKSKTFQTDTSERLSAWVEARKQAARPSDWAASLERKINRGVDMALDRINLPRRTDIEQLTEAMKVLETKMDALIKAPAPKAKKASPPKKKRTGILYRKF